MVAPSILFYSVAHLSEQVIAGNRLYTAPDPDSFIFAIIISSMLMTWQMTIGGRLESRLRFANKVVWNTLPLPEVSDKQRAAIIAAGQGVLEAREALETNEQRLAILFKRYQEMTATES